MSFVNHAVINISRHARMGKIIFYLPTDSYEVVSLIAHQYLGCNPRRGATWPDQQPDMLRDFCQHVSLWRSQTGSWCGTPYPAPTQVQKAVFSTWSYQMNDSGWAGQTAYKDFLRMVEGQVLSAVLSAAQALKNDALLGHCRDIQSRMDKSPGEVIGDLQTAVNVAWAAMPKEERNPPAAVREAYRQLQQALNQWAIRDAQQGFLLSLSAPAIPEDHQGYRGLSLHACGEWLNSAVAGGSLLSDLLLYAQYQTAQRLRKGTDQKTIPLFLYGTGLNIPSCLMPYAERIDIPSLEADDVRELVLSLERDAVNQLVQSKDGKDRFDGLLSFYVELLSVCSLPEARAILIDAFDAYDSLLNLSYVPMNSNGMSLKIFLRRRLDESLNRQIQLHGRLIVEDTSSPLNRPVGMDNVIQWYEEHKKALLSGSEYAPRGLLLTGVKGCGKSYFASWMAQQMNLPLLKLDMSAVLGPLQGDAESHMKEITDDLEKCGSFILLVDEVEKQLSGSKGRDTSGVMDRIIGKLLDWLQMRRNKKVFVIFTANDMSNLPGELTRTGRIDARFIVLAPRYRSLIQLLAERLERKGWRKIDAERTAERCLEHVWQRHHAFLIGANADYLAREILSAGHACNLEQLAQQCRPDLTSFNNPAVISCYQSCYAESYRPASDYGLPETYHADRPLIFSITSPNEDGRMEGNPYPLDITEGKPTTTEETYDLDLLRAVNEAMGRHIIRTTDSGESAYVYRCHQWRNQP